MYLRENAVEGRRWSCALYNQYGNWDDVIASTEYQTNIQPLWDNYKVGAGVSRPGLSCATWPPPDMVCNGCGLNKE